MEIATDNYTVRADLGELERRIERGLQTFVEVGTALLEIRDRRLYREAGYERFEDYCRERWGFSRPRTYQLIDAANVSRALTTGAAVSTFVDTLPANEAQARELARLRDPDAIRETWAEIQAEHGERVTARDIRDAVERRRPATTQHVCDECGEIFDRPMWHCQGCDAHWPTSVNACPDCVPASREPAPAPRYTPTFEPDERIEALKRARAELRTVLGIGSPDDTVNRRTEGLLRELERLILDARRARGELV